MTSCLYCIGIDHEAPTCVTVGSMQPVDLLARVASTRARAPGERDGAAQTENAAQREAGLLVHVVIVCRAKPRAGG